MTRMMKRCVTLHNFVKLRFTPRTPSSISAGFQSRSTGLKLTAAHWTACSPECWWMNCVVRPAGVFCGVSDVTRAINSQRLQQFHCPFIVKKQDDDGGSLLLDLHTSLTQCPAHAVTPDVHRGRRRGAEGVPEEPGDAEH